MDAVLNLEEATLPRVDHFPAAKSMDGFKDEIARFVAERAKVSKKTVVVDVGCGVGGQMFRMAKAGAHRVYGIDRAEFSNNLRRLECEAAGADPKNLYFYCQSMTELPHINCRDMTGKVDVVVCQQAINYLPYTQALIVLKAMAAMLKPGGRLYISTPWMGSEIANGYEDAALDVSSRFSRLSRSMSDKYQTRDPVCLYWEKELAWSVHYAGMTVLKSLVSKATGEVMVIGELDVAHSR